MTVESKTRRKGRHPGLKECAHLASKASHFPFLKFWIGGLVLVAGVLTQLRPSEVAHLRHHPSPR